MSRLLTFALMCCLNLGFIPSAWAQDKKKTVPPLEAKLQEFASAHKGKIGIAVKHLETGETTIINGDEVFQTASLIKLGIMAATMHQADEKKLDLSKVLTLTKDDKVPGSGILTSHFSDGATFTLRDAVRLMIVFSDNTATNMVLDQVGIKTVNERLASLGLPETRINSKVYKRSTSTVDPDRSAKYQLGSTSANETIKLLELIHTNKAATEASCTTMISFLKANEDHELLVRFLPTGLSVAHKTGATNQVRTDAGIFYIPDLKNPKLKHPVAVCVLTNDNGDMRYVIDNAAQVVIANIGKAVYDHYLIR